MPPSLRCIFNLKKKKNYLQIGGERIWEGVITKYVRYGLGCLYVYLPQFPQKCIFFVSHAKIKGVGRGGRLQKARYGGEVESALSRPWP